MATPNKDQINIDPNTFHPGYLGKMSVVDGLVRQFLYDATRPETIADSDFFIELIERYANIFMGHDPNHPQIRDWAVRHKLGLDCIKYLELKRFFDDDDLGSAFDVLCSVFSALFKDCMAALKRHQGNAEEAMPDINALLNRTSLVLLGLGRSTEKKSVDS